MSLLRITVLFVSKQKIEAHAYILLQIYPLKASKKYYHDGCKSYTKKWWQPHKKNCTCKRRIHDFYVFCIVECKAIILASGTINCYCCCCCCILMSRYIFKRGGRGNCFFNPWNGHESLTKIWRWFVYHLYTKSVHKSTVLYLLYTWCIHKKKQEMWLIFMYFFSIQQ